MLCLDMRGEEPPNASRRQFLRGIAGGSAVATGISGTAVAQETTQSGDSGGGGGATETVEVGPNGNYTFVPGTDQPLVIPPGTTVEFVWRSDNHNIHVDSQPEDASWSGHEPIENSGFTYTYTFDVISSYHYWCVPHKALGMVADLEVQEGGGHEATPAGPSEPQIPKSAEFLGIVTVSAMSMVLGFTYFFLKYGGDYGDAVE